MFDFMLMMYIFVYEAVFSKISFKTSLVIATDVCAKSKRFDLIDVIARLY